MSTRKKSILTLSVSVVLALLMGETAVRLFAPVKYHRYRQSRDPRLLEWIDGLSSYHPVLGYFTRSRLDTSFKTSEFTMKVTTNSRGFRDDEASLEAPDVLFLGDSFCFGWGVSDEETCDRYFEKATGLSCLNMGVAGYGNVQQYELLRMYCEDSGYRKQPVVLLVYVNDLRDNTHLSGPLYPRVRRAGIQTVIAPAASERYFNELGRIKRPKWYQSIGRYSCIGDLLVSPLLLPRVSASINDLSVDSTSPYPGNWVSAGESFELIFRKIRAYCEERPLHLFVAYIPGGEEIEKGEKHPHTIYADQVLTALGIPWIDLSEVLEFDDYYYMEGHLKPAGQRKMAEAVAKATIDLGWISDSK